MSDSKTSYGIAQAAWSAETPLSQLRTGNLMVAVSEESSAQIYGMAVQVLVDDFVPLSSGFPHLQGNLNRNNPLQGSLSVQVAGTGTGLQAGPYLPDK